MNKQNFLNILSLLKKHLIRLFIIFIIGLGIGSLRFFFSKPYYKTSFIAYSNLIANSRIADVVTEMQFRLSRKEYALLSKELNVPIQLLKDIRKIECKTIVNDDKNKFFEENFFIINLTYYNPKTVSDFKKSFIEYFNNIDYLKKKKEIQHIHNEETIRKIDDEIDNYNELQSKIILTFDKSSNSEKNQYITTSSSDKIIDLFQTKELLKEKQLLVNNVIVIVQDIMISDTPASFSIRFYLFIYSLFFVLIYIAMVLGLKAIKEKK